MFYGDVNNTVQEIGSGGGSGVYAASFSAIATKSNTTATQTITLNDNSYTHAFVFINSGQCAYRDGSSANNDYSRTVYVVPRGTTILYQGKADSYIGKFYITFSGNTITVTSIYAGDALDYVFAYAIGSGVILAYK